MRVEVTYYADDGKEFDNEKECREYEQSRFADFSSVMFFDEKFAVHPNPDIPFIESDAVYFKVLDAEKAARLFSWLYELCGACFPSGELKEGHVYMYDSEDYYSEDYWLDVTKRVEDLEGVLTKIEAAGGK